MNQQTPVAVLNNIMTKLRVVPKYEMVQGEHGETLFMMKVTCQMMPDGKILSACGSYGRSKQEAKHNAAIAFLTKFCNNGNIETERKTNTDNEQKTNTEITYRGSQMLLDICSKNKLERPVYTDFYIGGSQQYPIWVVQCKINYLSVEGRGIKKSEARKEAATRMYSILTTIGPISEILGFADFDEPAIGPKTVSCSNDPQECEDVFPPGDDVILTKAPRACRKPDVAKELLRLVNERKVAEKMRKDNDDSESESHGSVADV